MVRESSPPTEGGRATQAQKTADAPRREPTPSPIQPSLGVFLRRNRLIRPTIAVAAIIAVGAVFYVRQRSSPEGAAATLVLPGGGQVELLRVGAGSFLMGSDKKVDARADDQELWPSGGRGSVTLPDFYIGKYEVTIAQFKACTDTGGCPPRAGPPGRSSNYPVVNVSWSDALQYCEWLDQTVRSSTEAAVWLRSLPGDGWRVSLPSEAEWEKAARGTDGRTYPWGEGIDFERANYGDSRSGPIAVGSFPRGASPYGALDMSGNVSEWTRDPYRPYPWVPSQDGGLKATGLHGLRGGTFASTEQGVRAAFRDARKDDDRDISTGFRVVVSRF